MQGGSSAPFTAVASDTWCFTKPSTGSLIGQLMTPGATWTPVRSLYLYQTGDTVSLCLG